MLLLVSLISSAVCLPSPASQTNEYFAKLYWIMNSIKMSEIIQIQKLNGWWEEINFHFMKYFPIWNNITFGMSSFSALHNTLTAIDGREWDSRDSCQPVGYCDDIYTGWPLSDCDIYVIVTRYGHLADKDGPRSLMSAKECHQPVKLNIPTFTENLQFWPQRW